VQENRWYEVHRRELEESGMKHNGGPVPWVHTHEISSASILATEEAREGHRRIAQDAQVMDQAPAEFVCTYCFPRAMTRRAAIRHLRERYGT
jgi:hypothetical protein